MTQRMPHFLTLLLALPVFAIMLFGGMGIVGVCELFGVNVQGWYLFVVVNALANSVFLIIFFWLTGGWWISRAKLDQAFHREKRGG